MITKAIFRALKFTFIFYSSTLTSLVRAEQILSPDTVVVVQLQECKAFRELAISNYKQNKDLYEDYKLGSDLCSAVSSLFSESTFSFLVDRAVKSKPDRLAIEPILQYERQLISQSLQNQISLINIAKESTGDNLLKIKLDELIERIDYFISIPEMKLQPTKN